MSILCYHTVDPAWPSALALTPSAFAAHAEWLARSRTILPLGEALARLDGRFRPPRGTVALTFDDGFTGVYDHAFPVLRRLRLPATVFLVAQTLTPEGRKVDWVDRPPPAPLATLGREQVLEMVEAGVAFGSHSFAHRDLIDLGDEECERDLRTSREVLEALLDRPVPWLAYPRGRHDARVRRAAQRAGFSHAFALPEASETRGPFSIPRVGVYPGNGPITLRAKTTPVYLWLRTSPIFPLLRRATGRRGPSRPAG